MQKPVFNWSSGTAGRHFFVKMQHNVMHSLVWHTDVRAHAFFVGRNSF